MCEEKILSKFHLSDFFHYTTTSENEWTSDDKIDAIFIPTSGRASYVSRLLSEIKNMEIPIYLLPTTPSDYNASSLPENLVVLWWSSDTQFIDALKLLKTPKNKICLAFSQKSDLAAKRNYALWYSKIHGFSKILFLDDDIRGITTSMIQLGASCLRNFVLCGPFIDDFPDLSIIEHIANDLRENVSLLFISGGALFVRINTDNIGFFPPLYNEDWLFILPHLTAKKITVLGSIYQESYDPFADSSKAMFQEVGELIINGLFSLVQSNAYAFRHNQEIWEQTIISRKNWLLRLLNKSRIKQHKLCIIKALEAYENLEAIHCSQFIYDWERDLEFWNNLYRRL